MILALSTAECPRDRRRSREIQQIAICVDTDRRSVAGKEQRLVAMIEEFAEGIYRSENTLLRAQMADETGASNDLDNQCP